MSLVANLEAAEDNRTLSGAQPKRKRNGKKKNIHKIGEV